MRGARLADCNLQSARLFEADLPYCQLVGVNLSNADLSRAQVYGVASWDLDLTGARQRDLRITREGQGYFTVDTLDLAQFLYLLIEHPRMRDVLDTISLKTVLILGRFPRHARSTWTWSATRCVPRETFHLSLISRNRQATT
ncbi:MAG: pentapeptide repeat-containing protein [Solirubrobacterales bacterium]